MRLRLIDPILVGPVERIRRIANEIGFDLAGVEIVDAEHSHASAAKAVERGARRSSGSADERQPPYRRTDGRGRFEGERNPHRAPDQPLLHHGRARPPGSADRHRRGGQHRPRSRRESRHHPERDRSRARDGRRGGPGRDSQRDGDRHGESPLHDRGRGPVQDGGTRPDHRRGPRRAAGARQRDQPRGGGDQEDRVAGRGAREHSRRSGPRGRQHAGQEPLVSGEGGRRGNRARRARAGHSDQSRRFAAQPARLLRGRRDGRRRQAQGRRGCDSTKGRTA